MTTQPDWEQVKTCADQLSGADAERPALTHALRDARPSRYDILLLCRVHRLAHSLKVLVGLLEQFDNAGVAISPATSS